MTLEGYDISHHQATTPDLAGVDFVICRATYGTNPDDMYRTHVANARAAGKVVGAYHFARPTTVAGQTVAAQVASFLATAPDADFWVIDREKDGENGTITLTATRAFVDAIHATGRRIGLYTSMSNWREVGQDFAWVARWNTEEPTIPWDIWQYDGGGDDKIDNDRFRGTRGALLALGAPLQSWVDTQQAAAVAAIEKLGAEVVALETTLTATQQTLAETGKALTGANADLDAAGVEMTTVADAIRVIHEFERNHP